MGPINYTNMNNMQQQQGAVAPSIQYPYGNNMIMNSPYDNYMGRSVQSNPSNQYLKCRPVSSREEAMAFQIDLDGSLWVFPSVGNGKIYTKQINNDGTAAFSTYSLTKNENPFNSNEYVTKDEFNKVIQTIMAAMNPGITGNTSVQNNNINNEQQRQMDF